VVEFTPLFTAGLVLSLLALSAALARRLNQSAVPAYILLGVLVGPSAPTVGGLSLTLVETPAPVRLFADLGVVLLLFFVWLELSLDDLLRDSDRFLKAGAIDIGISLPLGVGIGLLVGFSLLESLFLALVVFNSSTVVIAKSLIDLGWVVDPASRAVLGVVVIEDIVTALGFAVLAVFLRGGTTIAALAFTVGQSLLFLVVLLAAAYYGSNVVERLFGTESSEEFLLGVLGVGALVAGAGLFVGVSEAVAAFVVGTAFARTRHAARVERLVAPSRDLFAAFFFFVIGLQTDPTLVGGVAGFVLATAAVTTLGQIVSGTLAGRAYGLSPKRSVRVGCALTPRGEFSLVIAAFLATAGTTPVLRTTIPAFTVGYVLVTSIAGTVLLRNSDAVYRLVEPFVASRPRE